MPIQSSRGAMSVQGFGSLIDLGRSEWLWTYRVNPAPATYYNPPEVPGRFYDTTTDDLYISFYTPLSYNTVYFGNMKTLKITKQNSISSINTTSYYNSVANPLQRENGFGSGSGTIYYPCGALQNIGGTYYARAGFLTTDSLGQITGGYYHSWGDATSYYANKKSKAFNIGGTWTVGHISQSTAVSSTHFATITSAGVSGFAKYFTYSGAGTSITCMDYNPADGFIYVSGVTTTSTIGFIAKYSTAGVLQWQRFITNPATANWVTFTFDGTDILLSVVYSVNYALIKMSNAGAVISGKTLAVNNAYSDHYFMKLSDGNYVINAVANYIVLNKSLDVINSFAITATGYFTYQTGYLDVVDPNKNIYLGGYTVTGSVAPYDTTQYVIKRPVYKKGTQSYTVGAGTVSIGAFTVTPSAITPTVSTGTLVENTITPTVAALSFFSFSDSPSTTISIQ